MLQLQKQLENHISACKGFLAAAKREEQRLVVRLLAVQRYHQAATQAQTTAMHDEELEEMEDTVTNIEAIKYDLTTYITQLRDKIAQVEQGISELIGLEDTAGASALARYIEADVRLCSRDAAVAREGYDELIADLSDLIHSRE